MNTSSIINHYGEERDEYMGSVAPPLFQTSNFCFSSVDEMKAALQNEYHEHVYSRGNNPTVSILRKKVAALEATEDCLVFASGCAATTSVVLSLLQAGDHIVSVMKPYTWIGSFFNDMLARFGIACTMVDGENPANFEAAISPDTKLIYLESPNSITLELQDIEAVTKIAKQHGIITMLDNTYSTPLYQNPAAMGVDIVVHSASKYFSGHSDVVAGIACGSTDMMQKVFKSGFMTLGGIISPHDAWLLLRGLRTMPVRLEKSRKNAEQLVSFLEEHPKVQKVIYPFASKNPQLPLAKKQMRGGNGLFSVILKEPEKGSVESLCESLQHFILAVSWGGYESLVFPMSALGKDGHFPANMIRVYAGLEEAEDLVGDFRKALENY
ncbi:MAG TPA: aminotransferase class I/II-fold pyridoxal phosphate-dependent enzyme [Bacteroidales bacterium]|nr:aminotransferase class I/II-fold pyridoxal phosphate-dependent enzyme [Bacteroidales bacterium]